MKKILLVCCLLLPGTVSYAADHKVTQNGARGDGKTIDTKAIQRTIDLCSEEGGGRAMIPAGTFLSGTIHLKDRVTLHLEEGAVLLGSADMTDYTPANLVRAVGVSDVGITGPGTIDGQGFLWWHRKENGHFGHNEPGPGMMVLFEDCRRIRMEGVQLRNAESWTVHLLGCEDAAIRGIRIRNPLHGPNNDGIDVQASRNVTISDCDIYTSDDAVVLKNRHPKYCDRPCENITVTNCVLATVCNAFKIGTETIGDFRNIVFSNSVVRSGRDTDSLAAVRKTYPPGYRAIAGIAIESVDGSHVQGVSVSNIVMEEVRVPIFIRLANRGAGVQKVEPAQPGTIRDVMISNVTVRHALYASSVTAIPGSRVENVILENISVTSAGGGDEKLAEKTVDERIRSYPDAHMWRELPASGFYVRHVKGLDMKTVRVFVDAPDRRPAVIFDDVRELFVSNLKTDAHTEGEAAVRLADVQDAVFEHLRTGDAARYVLDIRGETSEGIRMAGVPPEKVKSARKPTESTRPPLDL